MGDKLLSRIRLADAGRSTSSICMFFFFFVKQASQAETRIYLEDSPCRGGPFVERVKLDINVGYWPQISHIYGFLIRYCSGIVNGFSQKSQRCHDLTVFVRNIPDKSQLFAMLSGHSFSTPRVEDN